MNEEEELCDAMDAVDVDDDDDDEPSDLYKSIWKEVLQLSLEELTQLRNKASARIASIKHKEKNKEKNQKKLDDDLAKAKEYLAEMTRWKGAEKAHHSNPSEYYAWYKWNTDKYSQARDNALDFIKKYYKVDKADEDDEGGPAARGPVKGDKDGKDGKGGKDGAK